MNFYRNDALYSVLAALLSGVLLALCFPGWDLSGFVWVWMLPLLPAIWRGERKRYGFLIGYLSGLAFWLLNLKWIWTVSGLGALAMAAFLALYFGLWGMMAVSVGNPWRKRSSDHKASPKQAEVSKGVARIIAAKQASLPRTKVFGGALAESFVSLKFALINAAAWVGVEWLRGWAFTGFGWNGLGVAFHDTSILAQAADLVGVTGLAFVPVFMSAVIVQTGHRLVREVKTGKLRPRIDFGVAALLLALQFCYGVWRSNDVHSWETQRVRVLLIQENIPQTMKWDAMAVTEIMQRYRDSTQAALDELEYENAAAIYAAELGSEIAMKQPDFVIWPESAMPNPLFFIEGDARKYFYGDVQHLITNELQPMGNFTLISGMNEFEGLPYGDMIKWKPGGGQYNSIAVIPPGCSIHENTMTYRKLHLVIFGEYIPFKDELPFLAQLFEFSSGAEFTGNFSAGKSTEPLDSLSAEGTIQIIPSVCFEDSVGRLTRKFVRRKPQVIVNVTNDGWFKQSEAAAQHMANAKFRAIELRRPMIRSANTGVSGILSITGSAHDTVTGERQIIEDDSGSHFVRGNIYGHAYAPTEGPLTLYARYGDWFAWVMIALVVTFTVRTAIADPSNMS